MVGASIAGWLAGLPVVAGPILFLLVLEHGSDFVIALLRGMVLGRFSFAAFCVWLIFALRHQSVVVAFAESAVLSMLVQWATKRLANAQLVRSSAIAGSTEAAE